MTRISDPDRNQLPEQTNQVLNALPDLALFRLLSHSPQSMAPWLGFGGALLNDLSLSPMVRELAILQVAASTNCEYEEVQHIVIARGVGVPEDQIQAVVSQELEADCLKDHSGMLESIDHLIKSNSLTDTQYENLSSGLQDQEVVELLLVVGWYLSIALVINAVKLPTDLSADMAVIEASNTGSKFRNGARS